MTFPVGSIMGRLEITGAAQAEASVLGAQRSMNLAAGSAEKMAGAVNQADVALARSRSSYTSVTAAAAKLRAEQLSAVAATERYNTALNSGSASAARLASAEASMIRANARVASSMQATAASTRTAAAETSTFRAKMTSTVETVGKLGLAFGAFELARQAIDITKQAAAFQRDMLLIQTQAGASAGEVKRMSQTLLGLSGEVATAPDKLANALYHVESTGLRGAQALEAVKIAAEGAKVGNADLEETTNALTSAVVSGIGGVQNMAQAMGVLNTIVGSGDMNLSNLNEALGTGLLVAAKTFGVTIQEAGAGLAVFGDNNIRGADAATKLRMAMQDIAKPAATADSALGKIGLTAAELRSTLEKQGFTAALDLLAAKLKAAGVTGSAIGPLLEDAFTKKAGTGLAILIEQLGRFHTKLDVNTQGGKNFGAQWDATTKTTSYKFQQLGAELESTGIKIAQKVTPALGDTADVLTTIVRDGGKVVGALSPIAPLLERTAVTVGALWLGFKGYGLATTALTTVRGELVSLQATGAGAVSSLGVFGARLQATMAGAATETQLATQIMQADMAAMAASATAEAAVIDRAAANAAAAQVAMATAIGTASAEEIASMQAVAAAALAQAEETEAAAAATASAAEGTAAAVASAGDVAALGVAPMAALAGGALLLSGMLFKTGSSASTAATDVKSLTRAIEDDSGALGANTREQVKNALQAAGAFSAARTLGLSLKDVTDAALGNAGALGRVNDVLKPLVTNLPKLVSPAEIKSLKDSKDKTDQWAYASIVLSQALGGQSAAVKQAIQNAKDNAAADGKTTKNTKDLTTSYGYLVTAHGNLVQAEEKAGTALSDGTAAMQAQTQASTLLKNALDILNGVAETVEQTTDSFNLGLAKLANGTALARTATNSLAPLSRAPLPT